MIAQVMATRHADRVLSLTTTPSAPDHFLRWDRRRQAAAVFASGDRRAELSQVTAPTLVIAGEADALQPVLAERATAEAIPGARFVTYPGMGHDLPRDLCPAFVDEIHAIAEAPPATRDRHASRTVLDAQPAAISRHKSR